MRKYIILLLFALFCSPVLCAKASLGSLKVEELSKQEFDIIYTKVGEWKDGTLILDGNFTASGVDLNSLDNSREVQTAIYTLKKYQYMPEGKVSTCGGSVEIQNLQEGVYLIEGTTSGKAEIQSALVSIPSWDADKGEMNYNVKWNPKVCEVSQTVETGDENQGGIWFALCVISLLFVIRTLYFSLRLC